LSKFFSSLSYDIDSFFIRLNGVESDGNTPLKGVVFVRLLSLLVVELDLNIVFGKSYEKSRFRTIVMIDLRSTAVPPFKMFTGTLIKLFMLFVRFSSGLYYSFFNIIRHLLDFNHPGALISGLFDQLYDTRINLISKNIYFNFILKQ